MNSRGLLPSRGTMTTSRAPLTSWTVQPITRPSGDQVVGQTVLPSDAHTTSSLFADSRSLVMTIQGLPSSLAKATFEPSGDQIGMLSVALPNVTRVRVPLSVSSVQRLAFPLSAFSRLNSRRPVRETESRLYRAKTSGWAAS